MVKLNKFSIFVFMLLVLTTFVYANCENDIKTLEKYYQVSMDEDYEAYISLMDTEYIYDYLADEQYYRYYVEAAWEVYDTLDYSLEIIKCNELPTGSVIFIEVDSKIEAEGEIFEIERIYAAVFENGKIQFVMDYETFAFHQNLAYMLDYYNDTREIIHDALEQSEALIEFYENYEKIESTEQKKGFSWMRFLLFIIIAFLAFYYRKKLIPLFKKIKKKSAPFTKTLLKNLKVFYNTKLKPFLKTSFKHLKNFYSNKFMPFCKRTIHYIKTNIIPKIKNFIAKLKEKTIHFYNNKLLPFVRKIKKKINKLYNNKIKKKKQS